VIKNPVKIEQALRLRDVAIAAIEQNGIWGSAEVDGNTIKVRELQTGRLEIVLSTPFQNLPHAPLPYGLDIWSGSKVLSLWWNDAGHVELATFRPGQWQMEVAALRGHQ
jgi:hypothetical protein